MSSVSQFAEWRFSSFYSKQLICNCVILIKKKICIIVALSVCIVRHKVFLYIPNVYIIIFIFHMNHIQFFKLTMPFNPHKQVTSVAIHITVVVKLYRCGLCPRFIASAEIVSVVSVKVEVQDCHTVTHNHQTC